MIFDCISDRNSRMLNACINNAFKSTTFEQATTRPPSAARTFCPAKSQGARPHVRTAPTRTRPTTAASPKSSSPLSSSSSRAASRGPCLTWSVNKFNLVQTVLVKTKNILQIFLVFSFQLLPIFHSVDYFFESF